MSILSKITSKTGKNIVPFDCIRNNGRTLVIGGNIQRLTNTLTDYWNLIGYEIQSGPTMIITRGRFGSESSQVGYICDEHGITVQLSRIGPEPEKEDLPQFLFTVKEKLFFRYKAKQVPYILIRDGGKSILHGGRISVMEKDADHVYLLNDPAGPIYRVASPMTEIIEGGASQMGYICDESGRTVTLDTYIEIKKPDPIANNEITVEGDIDRSLPEIGNTDVKIEARFEGAVGKLTSLDKLTDIFDLGQSSRKFWFGVLIGLVIMFFLSRIF